MKITNITKITKITKKGVSPIGLLGEIVIVLAVIIILLAIVIVPRFFQQSEIVSGQIGGIQGDADKDSIRNFFDKCPCTFGDSLYEGCPAAFTEEQKQTDVKKYNSEPPCGITGEVKIGATADEQTGQKTSTEQKTEPAAFKQYQSVEIFGGDDLGADPQDGDIKQACAGWVGLNCPSEDNDCDDKFNLKPLTEGCWIMASEDDDTDSNDCGQAMADDGTSISLGSNKDLNVDLTNDYQSKTDENEPKNLFSWKWKSKTDYGSLICSKGFWYGCKEANEGRVLDAAGEIYRCVGSEWARMD